MYIEQSSPPPTVYPDDSESLPDGAVIDGTTASADISDSADYVVVGSGAAGATVALHLAQAGYSVAIIEEGPWIRTRDFGVDVYPAMKQMFREVGTNMAMGRTMFPLIQGRCVGGSTTINSAIAWRAPEKVIERWTSHYGLRGVITPALLAPHFDAIEESLNVRLVEDDVLGANNQLFAEAASKIGIAAQRIRRYDGGCAASASCLTGCRTGKKLGMNITYVPQALHRGARIYTSARVERVESRYGRAVAVRARLDGPRCPTLRIATRRGVLVAASAVQTPNILRRSGVRANALGKHFQVHYGTSLVGRFDRVVSMDFGATQGFNSMHFGESDRFKTETVALPPEMLAVRLPGVGLELTRRLANYRHLVNWAVIVRAEAEGTVRNIFGKDQVSLTPTSTDMAHMRKGMRTLSEMMFAVGAREVFPAVHGMQMLRSADDVKAWDDAPLDPRAYGMMASHLFGSARMGPDPRSSVVGLDFQVHGTRGLYVVDSSVFPTNIGVNPQHTIMALARLAADRILERPLPRQ
jgi:choline dehydrogenase-like flavoprotein